MRQVKVTIVFLVFLLAIFLITIYPGEKKKIEKTFKAKDNVKVVTINGSCAIHKGKPGEIKVSVVYSAADEFLKPELTEEGDTLLLREKFPTSSVEGEINWQLWVPEKIRIEFSSASGGFSAVGLKNDISASTASGDISSSQCRGRLEAKCASGAIDILDHAGEIAAKAASGDVEVKNTSGNIALKAISGDIEAENLVGDLELKVVSGDIEIKKAKGSFKITCASGDVEAEEIRITGESSFKIVSGDILVTLAESAAHDLTLDSATGSAVLDFNGNAVKGLVECIARAEVGKIVSPFKFDKEEEIYKHGKKYIIKSFKKDGDTPRITVKTATGKAILEK